MFSRGVCGQGNEKDQHPMVHFTPFCPADALVQCPIDLPTTARVAKMVEVPDATCVLYFLRSLLRVDSSIIQVRLPAVFIVEVCVGEVEKGACSECLSVVIPDSSPSGAVKEHCFVNCFRVYANPRSKVTRYQSSMRNRLGNPMERKAVSQQASRPFSVPQLSMERALHPLYPAIPERVAEGCLVFV